MILFRTSDVCINLYSSNMKKKGKSNKISYVKFNITVSEIKLIRLVHFKVYNISYKSSNIIVNLLKKIMLITKKCKCSSASENNRHGPPSSVSKSSSSARACRCTPTWIGIMLIMMSQNVSLSSYVIGHETA